MATADVITVYSISVPGLKFGVSPLVDIKQCKSSILEQLSIKTSVAEVSLYEDSITLTDGSLLRDTHYNILRLYASHPIPVVVRMENGDTSIIALDKSDSPRLLLENIPFSCQAERELYSVYRGETQLHYNNDMQVRHMETLDIKRDINLQPIHFIFPSALLKKSEHMPFVNEIVKIKTDQSIICLALDNEKKELVGSFMSALGVKGQKDLLKLITICEEKDKRIYEIELMPSACIVFL